MKIAGVNWNIDAAKKLTWLEFEALYKDAEYLKRVNLEKLYDRIQGCKGGNVKPVETEREAKKVVKKTIKKKP